jgi:hypothetical protein
MRARIVVRKAPLLISNILPRSGKHSEWQVVERMGRKPAGHPESEEEQQDLGSRRGPSSEERLEEAIELGLREDSGLG